LLGIAKSDAALATVGYGAAASTYGFYTNPDFNTFIRHATSLVRTTITDNPEVSAQRMYDIFMRDPFMNNMIPEQPVLANYVEVTLEFLASSILQGKLSPPTWGIAINLTRWTINFYAGLFHSAAWTAMRMTYSGRFGERMFRSMGM
jgi:hypothetical protein